MKQQWLIQKQVKLLNENIKDQQSVELIDKLRNEIIPLCIENNFTLHQVFEYTRKYDRDKYFILSQLWKTYFGKVYLRDCFRGGYIRKRN